MLPPLSFLPAGTLHQAPDLIRPWIQAGAADPGGLAELLLTLVRSQPRLDRKLADVLLAALEEAGQMASKPFQTALEALRRPLEETELGTCFLALWWERQGDLEEAIRLHDRLAGLGAGAGPSHAALTRLYPKIGRPEQACRHLRLAAGSSQEFPFLSRVAQQLGRLAKPAAAACDRSLKVALLCSSTTDLWVPLLRLALFREGIWAELFVPPYGTLEQQILDPTSAFYRFQPELVLLAPSWRDLQLPAFSQDPEALSKDLAAAATRRWEQIRAQVPAHIIQHDFEIPALDGNGHLGQILPGGRAAVLARINGLLRQSAESQRVTVLGLDQLAGTFGKAAWGDPSAWFTAKQYPAPAALPALVEGQVARIRAGLGLTKKVLVLDLDNTLWGGVIGEDGLGGIKVGPPSAAGEAHLALQRYAGQLKERGILLAVCSKNNDADARAPFLEHEAMHLRLQDFVAFSANWQDKPGNLRAMAQSLNLGLDSFVFLDDNPTERALMRRELPMVSVPEIGSDPARYVEILHRHGYFEADTLSAEDLQRSQSYRNNLEREALRSSGSSLDEFLAGLEMEAYHGAFQEQVLPRVLQLLGKTNQFNLTTRRHSEERVRRIMADPDAWTQYFRLKDKFDDNGLVGLMIALPDPAAPGLWEVDTWLMSCRVIGRQFENFMLNTLRQAALERGRSALRGRYLATAKNPMVADLYPAMGFTPDPAEPGCATLVLAGSRPMPAAFIRSMA